MDMPPEGSANVMDGESARRNVLISCEMGRTAFHLKS